MSTVIFRDIRLSFETFEIQSKQNIRLKSYFSFVIVGIMSRYIEWMKIQVPFDFDNAIVWSNNSMKPLWYSVDSIFKDLMNIEWIVNWFHWRNCVFYHSFHASWLECMKFLTAWHSLFHNLWHSNIKYGCSSDFCVFIFNFIQFRGKIFSFICFLNLTSIVRFPSLKLYFLYHYYFSIFNQPNRKHGYGIFIFQK